MPRKTPGEPRDAVLNVRIPEKTKYGLRLLSRLYHEPIPDIVIRAIDDVFTSENGGLFVRAAGEAEATFVLAAVWDELEPRRLAKLAFRFPTLLSRPEQQLWQRVVADDRYWQDGGRKKRAAADVARDEAQFQWDQFAEDWASLSKDLV